MMIMFLGLLKKQLFFTPRYGGVAYYALKANAINTVGVRDMERASISGARTLAFCPGTDY